MSYNSIGFPVESLREEQRQILTQGIPGQQRVTWMSKRQYAYYESNQLKPLRLFNI